MVWPVTPVTPPLEKVKETLCVTVLEGILAFMVQRVEKPLFLLVNVTLKTSAVHGSIKASRRRLCQVICFASNLNFEICKD